MCSPPPGHAYRDAPSGQASEHGSPSPAASPKTVVELHAYAWTNKALPQPVTAATIELISEELASLPSPPPGATLETLALTVDRGLQRYANQVDAATAWAIFDLNLLGQTDFESLLTLADVNDPGGIFAALVRNIEIPGALAVHTVQRLSSSTLRSRLLATGDLLASWQKELLVGSHRVPNAWPSLDVLNLNNSRTIIIIGALIRSLARWMRMSSSLVDDSNVADWITSNRSALTMIKEPRDIKEILRESGEFDVFVTKMLRRIDNVIQLDPGATAELDRQSETLFFERFKSVLDLHAEFECVRPFRTFEFFPLLDTIAPVGIATDRYLAMVDALAIDRYWGLVAPHVKGTERLRALILTALAALTAKQKGDKELLTAVESVLAILAADSAEPHSGAVPIEVINAVRSTVGLQMPSW